MTNLINVVHPNGITEQKPISSFDELQKIVGGFVDLEPLDNGSKRVAFNEDAKMLGLPRNKAYPKFLGTIVYMSADTLQALPFTNQ